ncbi:WXG100 family type VII secretion target [Amycolatopsis orientalis]|nr:WXG100 family type VII secretion target [Amycolatopsis orientalis]
MSYDQIYGATPEMSSFGLKTRSIGEEINAQVQSSLSSIQGLSSGWNGQASKAFEGVEFNRQGSWTTNTQNIDTMADGITQAAVRYSDVDDQGNTVISQVI